MRFLATFGGKFAFIHMRVTNLLILTLALTSAANAATVFGTAGNDILFLQGSLQSVSRTLVNPYSGAAYVVNGTYYVNTAIYDGLGGLDTLLMTNGADFLLLDEGGVQNVFNTERFIAGTGDDIVDLASSLFVLGPLVIEGGLGNNLLWGNAGNDTLTAPSIGNNTIDGGPGDDTISIVGNSAPYGHNQLYGGDGIDTVNLPYDISTTVILRQSLNQYQVDVSGVTLDSLTDIEFVHFASGETIDLSSLPIQTPEPGSLAMLGVGLTLILGI
jgi:RTX calcium-binding nonapeptide repeat (4 copies)